MTEPTPTEPPQDRPDAGEETLSSQLRTAAFGLVVIPMPDRPITSEQAAEVITAAQLMMRASFQLEATKERLTRHKATTARRERLVNAVLIGFLVAVLVFCAVGITLDALN